MTYTCHNWKWINLNNIYYSLVFSFITNVSRYVTVSRYIWHVTVTYLDTFEVYLPQVCSRYGIVLYELYRRYVVYLSVLSHTNYSKVLVIHYSRIVLSSFVSVFQVRSYINKSYIFIRVIMSNFSKAIVYGIKFVLGHSVGHQMINTTDQGLATHIAQK